MFFIKAAFWLTLVVALIPVNSADLRDQEQSVSTMETVGVAQALLSDVANICERNPETCEKGKVVLSHMGLKAREGARMLYTFLDEKIETGSASSAIASAGPASHDPLTTGSIVSD